MNDPCKLIDVNVQAAGGIPGFDGHQRRSWLIWRRIKGSLNENNASIGRLILFEGQIRWLLGEQVPISV
jgi:hypothetical protein